MISTKLPDGVPDVCPITKLPFFMMIEHPDLGLVPTYGGPYDSYTIPVKTEGEDGYYRERYDHDEGFWKDSEYWGIWC